MGATEGSQAMRTYSNALCYSPNATPAFFFEVMDHLAKVPDVCSGGIALGDDDVVKVDLATVRAAPECSLRVTLTPEVPIQQ